MATIIRKKADAAVKDLEMVSRVVAEAEAAKVVEVAAEAEATVGK